jgi:hypothetical protein
MRAIRDAVRATGFTTRTDKELQLGLAWLGLAWLGKNDDVLPSYFFCLFS